MTGFLHTLRSGIARRYPRFANAYLSYRLERQMLRQPMCLTPLGFQLSGHAEMQAGTFEPDEVALLRRHLPQADVFVDVGANVGFFVCLARSLGKRVVAIEPLLQNLRFLYANLRANGFDDVEVFPVALAESSGLGTLYGGGTGGSMIANWAHVPLLWQTTVPLTTLDTVLGDRFAGQRVFIKIDVEGAEYAVLRGATTTLSREMAPTWLVEVCLTENHPDGRNPRFREVFELFWRHGYMARVADRSESVVGPEDVQRWWQQGHRDRGYVNYLFARP